MLGSCALLWLLDDVPDRDGDRYEDDEEDEDDEDEDEEDDDDGPSSKGEPIVGTWKYHHAYDISLKSNVSRSSSYISQITLYADGSGYILYDSGVSGLSPSKANATWVKGKTFDDGGGTYRVTWYTEGSSPYFDLYYVNDGTYESVAAWNVQMPAYDDVFLYYNK